MNASGGRARPVTVVTRSGSVDSVDSRVSSGSGVSHGGSDEAVPPRLCWVGGKLRSSSGLGRSNRNCRGSDAWRYSLFTSTSWRGSRCPGIGDGDCVRGYCFLVAHDTYMGTLSNLGDDVLVDGVLMLRSGWRRRKWLTSLIP